MSDQSASDSSQRSFLVVDDEVFTQKSLVRILKSLGASIVETAENGIDALEKIDAMGNPPDVMLVDIKMPVMGGPELLRSLAGSGYEGAIVLASSADSQTLAVAESMAGVHGVNIIGVIEKPVALPVLMKIFEKLS